MPKPLPPHLRRLPPHVAANLSPEAKRELADFTLDMERDRRRRDAGGWAADPDGIPPFLRAVDAEAPGAADLWRRLPAPGPKGASLRYVQELGRRCGLTPEATAKALDALHRFELASTGPHGTVSLGPAGVDD